MAKLFIFRHGQTFDNKDEIFSGWRNTDLTPDGVLEAEGIGEKLKDEKVTRAYQSDLLRSQHTLQLVLDDYHQGVEVIIDARIKERDYGNLTGESKKALQEKDPENFKLWHRSYDVPPPGGESIKDVEVRVLEFLNQILPTLAKDEVVLISAHGNSIRPMRRYFEHLTIDEMCSYENTPGKIYSYEI